VGGSVLLKDYKGCFTEDEMYELFDGRVVSTEFTDERVKEIVNGAYDLVDDNMYERMLWDIVMV
jgi:hypothetical protein